MYNWQDKNWPNFEYSTQELDSLLYDFNLQVGIASGIMDNLSEETKTNILIDTMVSEAISTSKIEGELLDRNNLVSSIRRNMGIPTSLPTSNDYRAEGIAKMMIEVRSHYFKPLSRKMLFEWHELLMLGNYRIKKGKWRTSKEPMYILSGAIGREKIHFKAPPSHRIPDEMRRFVKWYNESMIKIEKPIVHAALSHIYFESIHPFEDGNGRIGRAIVEKSISQNLKCPIPFNISKHIELDRKKYYKELQKASLSLEVSSWVNYFIQLVYNAQIDLKNEISRSLKVSKFFNRHKDIINSRQLKVIKRILSEGSKGFEGGMNTRKYVAITKSSKATATRDLQDLSKKGIFKPIGSGRSTRYEIIL